MRAANHIMASGADATAPRIAWVCGKPGIDFAAATVLPNAPVSLEDAADHVLTPSGKCMLDTCSRRR